MKLWLHIKTTLIFLNKGFIPYLNVGQVLEEKQKINMCRKKFKIKVHNRIKSVSQLLFYMVSMFSLLFITFMTLSIFYFGLTIIQPAFNSFINSMLSEQNHSWTSIYQIILYIFIFKTLSSFLIVFNDGCQQFLGVRLYSLTTSLIMSRHSPKKDDQISSIITLLEDDSQRLVWLPYSLVTVVLKNLQFFFFTGYIISKADQSRGIILTIYGLFFILCLLIAYQSSQLNMKILKNKQFRLNFSELRSEQIKKFRRQQIKDIKKLMFFDGLTLCLPDVVNISVMIIIYSINNLDKDTRYILLVVFGLLRINISGLGYTYNLLAQTLSSFSRIFLYLKSYPDSDYQFERLQSQESYHSSYDNTQVLRNKKVQISKILNEISSKFKHFKFFFVTLVILLNSVYFLYGYCAKSLTKGGSILEPFNFIILILQIGTPVIFFVYICWNCLHLSNSIYEKILRNPSALKNLDSQQINRLSGDLRQLDRLLYMNTQHNFTSMSKVFSSIIFTIVQLNNIGASAGFVILVISALIFIKYLFHKIMDIRRYLYRNQSLSKGELLLNLKSNTEARTSWTKIHSYKQYGYLVENLFIMILYLTMTVLICLLTFIMLMLETQKQSVSVLVMIALQLDAQFFIVCINWIQFQISLTSTERCILMTQNIKQSQISENYLNQSQFTTDNTAKLIE